MNIKLKTLSLCAVVAGILFVFLGLQAKSAKQQMDSQGVSVPGTIVKAETQVGSKGKKRYVLLVDWAEGAVRHNAQKFVVKKDFFQTRVRGDMTISAPEITIRSLPGKVDSAIIVGGSSDFGGMEWLGAIVGLLGLWGTWKAFFARRSA